MPRPFAGSAGRRCPAAVTTNRWRNFACLRYNTRSTPAIGVVSMLQAGGGAREQEHSDPSRSRKSSIAGLTAGTTKG
jgi:hypothetical protein